MSKMKRRAPRARPPGGELVLYVANNTASSVRARTNLRKLWDEYVPGGWSLRVIDLAKNPELAAANDIVAIPTLVRIRPAPKRALVGTLADTNAVLKALGLVPGTENTVAVTA